MTTPGLPQLLVRGCGEEAAEDATSTARTNRSAQFSDVLVNLIHIYVIYIYMYIYVHNIYIYTIYYINIYVFF